MRRRTWYTNLLRSRSPIRRGDRAERPPTWCRRWPFGVRRRGRFRRWWAKRDTFPPLVSSPFLITSRPAFSKAFCGLIRRTVFAVREQIVAVWIDARGDRGAVNVGHRRIDGMMTAKCHAFAGEFPERGSVVFADEIRTHPVPDDDDNMALGWSGLCFAEEGRGEKAGEEREETREQSW